MHHWKEKNVFSTVLFVGMEVASDMFEPTANSIEQPSGQFCRSLRLLSLHVSSPNTLVFDFCMKGNIYFKAG